MTNNEVTLSRGDQYVVFYTGGPYDGQTDTRISTDGSYDETVTVLVSLDGKESQLVYGAPEAKSIGGSVQVHYTWDATASEALEDPEERLSDQ
ncbi:oligoribonuclease [Conyzicola sp.]|uniref:oligoribonuclease n=1 Tax=Conyzicola sp. TaxID=1969404 RepID=UPI0039895AB7